MDNYKCNLCNKCFNNKGHYNAHKQRKNPCANFEHNYFCDKCDKPYATRGGLNYHKTQCKYVKEIKQETTMDDLKKQNEELVKLVTGMSHKINSIDDINENVKTIQRENIELKNKLNNIENGVKMENVTNVGNVFNTTNTNSNNNNVNNTNNNVTIQYVTLTKQYIKDNLLEGPVFAPITDYTSLHDHKVSKKELGIDRVLTEKEKEKFVNELLSITKNRKLVDFLGSYIILRYKKETLTLRTLWATDAARRNYMVKLLAHEIFWKDDIGGNFVNNKIIAPLLMYLLTLVNDYLKKADVILNLDLCKCCNDLCKTLTKPSLTKNILNYISPLFAIDSTIKYDPKTLLPLQLTDKV